MRYNDLLIKTKNIPYNLNTILDELVNQNLNSNSVENDNLHYINDINNNGTEGYLTNEIILDNLSSSINLPLNKKAFNIYIDYIFKNDKNMGYRLANIGNLDNHEIFDSLNTFKEICNNLDAMNIIFSNDFLRDIIKNNNNAMSIINSNNISLTKLICHEVDLDNSLYDSIEDISNSEIALNKIISSKILDSTMSNTTAMDILLNNEYSINIITKSSLAREIMLREQSIMEILGTNEVAITKFLAAEIEMIPDSYNNIESLLSEEGVIDKILEKPNSRNLLKTNLNAMNLLSINSDFMCKFILSELGFIMTMYDNFMDLFNDTTLRQVLESSKNIFNIVLNSDILLSHYLATKLDISIPDASFTEMINNGTSLNIILENEDIMSLIFNNEFSINKIIQNDTVVECIQSNQKALECLGNSDKATCKLIIKELPDVDISKYLFLDDIINDYQLMTQIANNETTINILVNSSIFMSKIIDNDKIMKLLLNSTFSTYLIRAVNSEILFNSVTAMNMISNNTDLLNKIFKDTSLCEKIYNNENAARILINNLSSMYLMSYNSNAMNIVCNSDTAINEIIKRTESLDIVFKSTISINTLLKYSKFINKLEENKNTDSSPIIRLKKLELPYKLDITIIDEDSEEKTYITPSNVTNLIIIVVGKGQTGGGADQAGGKAGNYKLFSINPNNNQEFVCDFTENVKVDDIIVSDYLEDRDNDKYILTLGENNYSTGSGRYGGRGADGFVLKDGTGKGGIASYAGMPAHNPYPGGKGAKYGAGGGSGSIYQTRGQGPGVGGSGCVVFIPIPDNFDIENYIE